MTNPMDQETLEKIGGKVKWIDVPYTTTKLSVETGKNKWQTAGGDTITARVEVGSEADPEAVFNATREWLKQLAVEANEATLKTLNKAYKAYHQPVAHGALPSETEPVLRDAPVAKTAPVAQPAQQPTPQSGDLTFPVETLSVEVKGGKRYVKAKGGNFKVYGVNVWPEVLALPPLEWDLETLDGADYNAPAGLTAIYVEKEIVGKQGEPKWVPDKVTGWK